jgi:hypothetical protein
LEDVNFDKVFPALDSHFCSSLVGSVTGGNCAGTLDAIFDGDFIHHGLVQHAAFAVECDHLRFEAVRLNLGSEMIDDVLNLARGRVLKQPDRGSARGLRGDTREKCEKQ